MYDELIARIRYHIRKADFMGLKEYESNRLLDEAADAIVELQAVVDRLTAQTTVVFEKTEGRTVIKFEPKWIPVTERLPEAGKKVLVFAYGYDTITARMCKKTEDGYPVFECKGYDGIYREMAKPGRITHWMPLPQPPESEDE